MKSKQGYTYTEWYSAYVRILDLNSAHRWCEAHLGNTTDRWRYNLTSKDDGSPYYRFVFRFKHIEDFTEFSLIWG